MCMYCFFEYRRVSLTNHQSDTRLVVHTRHRTTPDREQSRPRTNPITTTHMARRRTASHSNPPTRRPCARQLARRRAGHWRMVDWRRKFADCASDELARRGREAAHSQCNRSDHGLRITREDRLRREPPRCMVFWRCRPRIGHCCDAGGRPRLWRISPTRMATEAHDRLCILGR